MPYIHQDIRFDIDAHIDQAIREVRAVPTSEHQIGACRSIIRRIAKMVSAGTEPYVLTANDTNVERLAKQIHNGYAGSRRGVLNYVFTRIVVGSFKPSSVTGPTAWSYHDITNVLAVFERTKLELFSNGINDLVLTALEAAKLEFYCRVAVPKERKARIENGDIQEYAQPDCFP